MKYNDSDYKELIETHHFILEGEPIPDSRPRFNKYGKPYDERSKDKKRIKKELAEKYQGKLYVKQETDKMYTKKAIKEKI